MDIVVANGFVMERCTFFSREYHCCVLHNTRCKCEDYNPRNSKPITKADLIRVMSDEELADFLYATWKQQDAFSKEVCEKCPETNCQPKCWLDWLKQEVEEDD